MSFDHVPPPLPFQAIPNFKSFFSGMLVQICVASWEACVVWAPLGLAMKSIFGYSRFTFSSLILIRSCVFFASLSAKRVLRDCCDCLSSSCISLILFSLSADSNLLLNKTCLCNSLSSSAFLSCRVWSSFSHWEWSSLFFCSNSVSVWVLEYYIMLVWVGSYLSASASRTRRSCEDTIILFISVLLLNLKGQNVVPRRAVTWREYFWEGGFEWEIKDQGRFEVSCSDSCQRLIIKCMINEFVPALS